MVAGFITEKKRALQFFDPFIMEDLKVALIEETVFTQGGKAWENSIMLYMVGPRPKYFHFKAYANKTWRPKGDFEIYLKYNGFYLIKFKLQEDMGKVLNGGPYFFDGRLIIISGTQKLGWIETYLPLVQSG